MIVPSPTPSPEVVDTFPSDRFFWGAAVVIAICLVLLVMYHLPRYGDDL